MFKRVIAFLQRRKASTYQEVKQRFEAQGGRAKSVSDTAEFEAVAWMVSSGDNPRLALTRFEKESLMPDNDMEESLFEQIRSHLRRWGRQTGVAMQPDRTAVFDATIKQTPTM